MDVFLIFQNILGTTKNIRNRSDFFKFYEVPFSAKSLVPLMKP